MWSNTRIPSARRRPWPWGSRRQVFCILPVMAPLTILMRLSVFGPSRPRKIRCVQGHCKNCEITCNQIWLTLVTLKILDTKDFACPVLTRWGRDNMGAFTQTFSNAFSWLKTFCFNFDSHSPKFVPKGPIKCSSIGWDNGLAPARRQAIVWTNVGWFADAYESLCLNELNQLWVYGMDK